MNNQETHNRQHWAQNEDKQNKTQKIKR